jgi:hypothetical protein
MGWDFILEHEMNNGTTYLVGNFAHLYANDYCCFNYDYPKRY